jgi:hypothetical protein
METVCLSNRKWNQSRVKCKTREWLLLGLGNRDTSGKKSSASGHLSFPFKQEWYREENRGERESWEETSRLLLDLRTRMWGHSWWDVKEGDSNVIRDSLSLNRKHVSRLGIPKPIIKRKESHTTERETPDQRQDHYSFKLANYNDTSFFSFTDLYRT